MSRRKQSNPKPLKSGDEESWTEGDEKPDKTMLEDAASAVRDVPDKEQASTSPATPVKSEEARVVKIEPESENSSDRSDGTESVIKRATPPAATAAPPDNDAKMATTVVVKNEPIASPVPAANPGSMGEQEFAVVSQNLQSALTGARYYPTAINAATTAAVAVAAAAAAAAAASDARYRPETLDIRQGFLCSPCGIRFSSLSTLEAHQTYYCSHRAKKINKGGAESEGEDGRALSVSGGYDQDEGSSGENMSTGEPSAKNAKTGKQYRCTHCSYSADKKVSLNRHMRMHSASPASSVQNDSDSSVPPVDRYCQECDIRFSNLKTFRAHKLHYCSTRNVIKRTSNPSTSPGLPVDSRVGPPPPPLSFGLAATHGTAQPFVALPTNPVLIVPYSLIQAGNVLSGPAVSHLSSHDAVYLLMADGSIQMVTQRIANQQPVRVPDAGSPVLQPLLTTNNNQVRKDNNISPKSAKSVSIRMSNGALDLRTRRESNCSESTTAVDVSEEEKENRLIDDQADHEDIVCAPSIPLILSTSSNCSTPSPMPLSPESHHGRDKLCSPSPKSVIKSVKKLTNGVIHRTNNSVAEMMGDEKKLQNGTNQNASAAAAVAAAAAAVRLNTNFNLSEMLLAAVSQNPDAAKELQFTPEMIPHLNAIQQMSSAKRPALNPIANVPLLLPPAVSPGSRGIPDLLNPSILPLLTSELAMRLASSVVPPSGPQYVRTGTWKCDDCNIGFCKYENYVAHKKHYCSTRKLQDQSPAQSDDSVKTSPAGSPSSKAAVSPQPFSKENTSPVPPQSQAANVIQSTRPYSQQFVCTMCGIKFTSLDNLTTHQTFYCTNRIAIAAADDAGDNSSLKCPKCKILLPVDQLPAHQCTGASNAGWRCPCCPVVCSSTNAIQKHFESHTGVKAFLCTICNYKGNTIRGMRTHIRVHFDKRNGEIMEENFITCLMEDTSSTVSSNDENSADKLSSIKKSPSERERVESAPPSEGKSTPVENRSPAPLVVDCAAEDEDEYIEVDELPAVKEEPVVARVEPEDGGSGSAKTADRKSPLVAAAAAAEIIDDPPAKKYGPNYCKSCDISFNYLSTFIAHKKYYCTNNPTEVSSPLSAAESLVIPTNMATAAHTV